MKLEKILKVNKHFLKKVVYLVPLVIHSPSLSSFMMAADSFLRE